jgi:hypothetical protein
VTESSHRAGRVRDAVRWLLSGSRVVLRGARDIVSLFRGGLHDNLDPWMSLASADDIPYEELAGHGVRAVLFDLENTLIPPGGPFTADGRAIVERVRSAGLSIAVVSNASATWVHTELGREGIPFVAPAGKPGRDAFERGCALLGIQPAEAVYVGDQMITDILGSQRAGLRAILVRPRYDFEGRSARFQRRVSRLLLRVTGR